MSKFIAALVVGSVLVPGIAEAQGRYAAAPEGYSTDELKEDVAPLSEQEAFSALEGLTPVTFSYRYDPTGDMQVGFAAADVPDLLSIPGRQSVAPLDIIAVLTKVVQSQQAAIAALEESLRSLRGD